MLDSGHVEVRDLLAEVKAGLVRGKRGPVDVEGELTEEVTGTDDEVSNAEREMRDRGVGAEMREPGVDGEVREGGVEGDMMEEGGCGGGEGNTKDAVLGFRGVAGVCGDRRGLGVDGERSKVGVKEEEKERGAREGRVGAETFEADGGRRECGLEGSVRKEGEDLVALVVDW